MPNAKPDKPLNRKEQYLNRISGDNTQELPMEDLNREEQYLRAIVDHVGAIEEATDGLDERITTLEESDKEQNLQIENLQSDVTTATETAEAAKATTEELRQWATNGINVLFGTNSGADNWSSPNATIETASEAGIYGSLPYSYIRATFDAVANPVLRFALNSTLTKQILKPNTNYTVSLEIAYGTKRFDTGIYSRIGYIDLPATDPNSWTTFDSGGAYLKDTHEFQQVTISLTTKAEFPDLQQPYLYIMFSARAVDVTKGDWIMIRNLSLVETPIGWPSSKADPFRDWQPNPYEVPELAAQIDAVDVDVSGIHDSIQGIDESISSLEQSVTDIQTEAAGVGKITENGVNIVSNLVENWEQGGVNLDVPVGTPYDTTKDESTARIRMVKPIRTNHPFTVSVSNPDYLFNVKAYNDADLFQVTLTADYTAGKQYFDTNYDKIAISIRRADNAPTITPENILDVGLKVQLGNVDLPIYTPPTVDINANAEAIAELQQRTVYPPDVYRGDSFGGLIVNITGDSSTQDAKTAIIEFGKYRMVHYPDSGLVSVAVELINWSFCNYTSTELEQLSFTIPQAIFKPDGDMTVIMPGGIAMLIQPSGNATFYCPWIPTQDSTVSKRVDAYGTGYFTFTYLLGDGAGG